MHMQLLTLSDAACLFNSSVVALSCSLQPAGADAAFLRSAVNHYLTAVLTMPVVCCRLSGVP